MNRILVNTAIATAIASTAGMAVAQTYPVKSVPPPGAKGAMMRTGLTG